MVASDACTPEGRIPVGPGDIPQPFGGLPLARAPSRVHDARVTTRGSSSGAAGSLLAIVVVQSVTTLVLGAGGDAGLSALLDGFVLSNATIGLALAVAGWPVARHRPRNVVGWLLLVGGLAYATSAAGYTLLARMPGSGDGRALWRVVQHTPSRVTFPGGESIRRAQARAVDLTEELATNHRGEVVVCVTHADVIKAVVAHHLAMPLDAFQRLVVDPASATALQLPAEGPPTLRCFNDVGGIAAALPRRTAGPASSGGAAA